MEAHQRKQLSDRSLRSEVQRMKTQRVAPVSGRSFVRKDCRKLDTINDEAYVNEKQVGKVRQHSPDPNQLDV